MLYVRPFQNSTVTSQNKAADFHDSAKDMINSVT